jgi:mRNA-degrading endonuclease toxin of MazEF toxin-antitoxin module
LVAPLTDSEGKAGKRLFVEITSTEKAGLEKPSVVDCYQIRALDRSRIVRKMGTSTPKLMSEVRARLKLILNLV